jgi:hypothetical protein
VVTVTRDEELGAERVAKGEPEKGLPSTLKTVKEHLLAIFAEGPSARRPAEATAEHGCDDGGRCVCA